MIMIKKRNLLVILFSLIAVSFLSAKSYYVKPVSSGQGSGISWAHASNNLQDMINNASAGDTICVAAGTYYGGFTLKDGVCMGGISREYLLRRKTSHPVLLYRDLLFRMDMPCPEQGLVFSTILCWRLVLYAII